MRAREALGALQCGLHDMADGKLSIESIAGRHALEDWPDRSEIEQTLRDLVDVNRQIGEMEILEQQMFGTE